MADGRLPRSSPTASCARESKAVRYPRKSPVDRLHLGSGLPAAQHHRWRSTKACAGPPQAFPNLSQQMPIPGLVNSPVWTRVQGPRGGLVGRVVGWGRRGAGSLPLKSRAWEGDSNHHPRPHLSLVPLREQSGRGALATSSQNTPVCVTGKGDHSAELPARVCASSCLPEGRRPAGLATQVSVQV